MVCLVETMAKNSYKRVLLKVSGEAFLGKRESGIDPEFTLEIAKQIQEVVAHGIQMGIVIGGGNMFRGTAAQENGLDRATGDYIGMLATVMNALALQEALEKVGVPTRVQSAIAMPDIAEPYIRRRAIRHMEKGRVVIFAAGTGNPFFSTDMAGALRALETNCEILFKATKVDGVYDKDPVKFNGAKKFEHLRLLEAQNNPDIKVMDTSAIALCAENSLPIVIFNLLIPGNLKKAVTGEAIGSRLD